jgi:hypothetical protein
MFRARQFRVLLAAALVGCARHEPTLFEALDSSRTGVTFVNAVPESDTAFNIINYLYYYDGGGVAVGDVDRDGRPDLYFTSNRGANRLYLNRGDYHFEDVTAQAGVADTVGWKTGVTMADVNGDGWVDIYVCGVDYLSMHGRNVLYVNNHDGTFTDRTAEYGLAFTGYSTQALFFDYDGDGDLDMYLLNHSVHAERRAQTKPGPQREPRNPRGGDRLYRNDGGRFTDVSEHAHIYGGAEGYGLGVVASDVNLDGCIDLYVANDFDENDFLYLNNCDGTFTESVATAMPHVSHASMGVDAADFNNDGRPDVVVADMLPDSQAVLNTSANADRYESERIHVTSGYHPQVVRNTLQLNRGDGRFSDIAWYAGVAATDWSWTALFADLDNDGRKDLFITSGIYRRPNNLDFVQYITRPSVQQSMVNGMSRADLRLLALMPHVAVPNAAFRNNGDLTFTNLAADWGLDRVADSRFGNGAVYADLNNSGALDLVINNVNAPASLYRNRSRERGRVPSHFLRVDLRGDSGNIAGIGATVRIRTGSRQQLVEVMATRGFQSAVDVRPHFGLGADTVVDSLVVIWPDRRYQVLTKVAVDRALTLSQSDAAGRYAWAHDRRVLFDDITDSVRLPYRHREDNGFVDFYREPLMPHLVSREGPALAVGDANGDGLEDLFLGGARGQAGGIYVQRRDGTFAAADEPALRADSASEDVDAAFLDANGDGRPDLYVVSGGNAFSGDAPPLQDRLYVNDGEGRFRRDTLALPRMTESGSCVAAADFNHDGRVDLFVGRQVVAGAYGTSPRSLLLQNDGAGHFTDATAQLAPALANAGMVTSAAWLDYDGDGALDLVVVGEWMTVHLFHQEHGHFVDRTDRVALAGASGWWRSVSVADVNGDGRPDLILGNLGMNSYIRASRAEPARLYVGAFGPGDARRAIATSYRHHVSYPLGGRDEFIAAFSDLADRYGSYSAFGASRLEDIFSASVLSRATVLEANDLASYVAINGGHGGFALRRLPAEAQLAPISASLVRDFDGDGHPDVLVAGNLDGVTPLEGTYDASYGVLLRGDGGGGLSPVDIEADGLIVTGQVRRMRLLASPRWGTVIIMARNDDSLQILRPNRQSSPLPPLPPTTRP